MSIGTEAPARDFAADTKPRRALYSPFLDFLLLGGGSLFVLPVVAAMPASFEDEVLYASFLLSFVINYPHFAHSYQIFYRSFGSKIGKAGAVPQLRYRYIFAGLVVPAVLLITMLACFASGSAAAMGVLASAMAFFVGWHYVKQGYGMLIVDAVVQHSFFTGREKNVLKVNAYCGWIFAFLLASHQFGGKDFLGFKYVFPPVPLALVVAAAVVAAIMLAVAVHAAVAAARRNGSWPVNGYVAYATSVYIWLATVYSPAVYFLIPAFHSLQYLAVVWKYEFRREASLLASRQPPPGRDTLLIRYAIFIGIGLMLGTFGLYLVPNFLEYWVDYEKSLYGGPALAFMILIFVNIHHYFLDNVMWRKDNPDVSRHLFAAAARSLDKTS